MENNVQWEIKHFNELSAIEYHQILALRTAIFVVEQNCPYQEVDYKDLNSCHLWGSLDDQVIAVTRIVEPGISYPEISIGRVAVDKKFRGTNISRDLMLMTISFIEKIYGKQAIRISAQEHLQSYYHKFDFKTVGQMYLEDDIPHAQMLRQ